MALDRGSAQKHTNARSGQSLLFEIAWEVCQQVGGIYTVLRSKAPRMVDAWGRRYFTVGPYNPETSPMEFEDTPPRGRMADAIRAMRDEGIEVHFGRWLVTGQPQTILIDVKSILPRLAEIKYNLWKHHDIPGTTADPLFDSVLAFGHGVERFFHHLTRAGRTRPPMIAHCHEWMAGAAIPELRRHNLPVSIVFTTHATTLGRYEAMNNENFYDRLDEVDWLASAKRYNIEAQTRLERACAHGSHVFTTVSDITADECEHLLGRPVDLVLPNGLNIERFVAMHEFQNLHLQYKEQIHRFVMGLFFPSYTFDLDRTLYLFSSGRYEYRNKGFDMTLESLARLNTMLKAERSDQTIVFFLVTKRDFHTINPEVLRRTAMLDELGRNCEAVTAEFGQQLFRETARGEIPDMNALIGDYWRLRLLRLLHARQTNRLPAIVTHDLVDDANDEVLKQLRYLGLFNGPDDPVKVVYHPDFITSSCPLLAMDYDHFVRGCHLGVFPSFYEPWGYTPLECIARGIPAVTSDLSGFGAYVQRVMPDHDENGIYVAKRRGTSMDEAADSLARWLREFCRGSRRERIKLRNRVESDTHEFDWTQLGTYYDLAHDMALERLGKKP